MLEQKLSRLNGRQSSLWSSDMPPEIIHHILSFLPSTREAAKTCILSKCWLHAWRSYFQSPSLIFINTEEHDPRKIQQFHNFVEQTMSRLDDNRNRRSWNIQKFVFVSGFIEIDDSLNKWIHIAIDNNVQEMTLSKIWYFSSGFLQSVLNNTSLRCLDLNLWASDITSGIHYYSIDLPNVVTLTLTLHMHDFRGELLKRVLKGCPLLETLTIASCNPASEINLTGSDHLKTVDLRLRYPKSVHIYAPNLVTLRCDTINIGKQSVLSIGSSAKLKHLDLEFVTLDTGWFEGFISRLGSLETLKLKFEKSLSVKDMFSISNPSIKNMVLNRCMSPEPPLVIVDAVKLSYFRYIGCMNSCTPGSGLCVYPSRDCIAHLTLMLDYRMFNWLSKLFETISPYSNNLRSLSLVYCGKEYHEIGRWWEDTNLSSTTVIETEHMKLIIDDDELHSELFFPKFNKLVSGLFLICHPAIVTIEANSGNDRSEITRNDLKLLGMDVMIEDQDNEVECEMCSIFENKCWKHQLKEVKIKEDEFIPKERSAVNKISFMLKW